MFISVITKYNANTAKYKSNACTSPPLALFLNIDCISSCVYLHKRQINENQTEKSNVY